MAIVVTATTGHLGRLVVETLLERGAPAGEIVATARDTARIEDLAARGVQTRRLDYADPGTIRDVLGAGDRVLLVSGNEFGQRAAQHRAVIDAAADAGVAQLAYTSIANADRTSLELAAEHQATEQALISSGVPYALLRNGWYFENYTAQLPTYVEHGAVLGSAGEGGISGATRADYAAAAAAVLLAPDPAPAAIYELGGDQPFTLADLATEVAQATGREVSYRDLPVAEYAAALTAAGVPQEYAAILPQTDTGIAAGDLLVTSGDLSRLIGRPTTPLRDAIALAAAEAGVSV